MKKVIFITIMLFMVTISVCVNNAKASGADYIVIATNTIHKLADDIQSQINIPLIHIADCVAEKCLDSEVYNVGLLGTKITMVEDFLIDRLEKNGLIVSTPTSEEQLNEVDRIIFDELCKGIISEKSRKFYIDVINQMIREKHIEGIILGCTEIEMLIKSGDIDIPIFDTTQSHIDKIVDCSLERSQYVYKR